MVEGVVEELLAIGFDVRGDGVVAGVHEVQVAVVSQALWNGAADHGRRRVKQVSPGEDLSEMPP